MASQYPPSSYDDTTLYALEQALRDVWQVQNCPLLLQLLDLLDCEVAILGRDPHVGPISDGQSLHHEFDGFAQVFEMPLVAAPIRSSVRNLIGRDPVHVRG
jgi:hypothetical protein